MKTPHYIPGKDINYDLIREINEKIKRINTHSEYSNTLKKNIIKTLIEEANAHSFIMELNGNSKENQTDLRDTWGWIKNNYKGEFSHDFLINLTGRIVPNQELGYRKYRVRVIGEDSISPINPEKIPSEMISLIDFLNDPKEEPLIKAIFGHLHLVRIHPFYDGNGRASRMIQNLILDYNKYTPIRIETGERTFYQKLLRGALKNFEKRQSIQDYNNGCGINLFFEYLASIENINLDRLEDELKKKREFGIYVGDNKKGKMFTAKNILRSRIKKGISIRLDQKKDIIFLKGDVGWREIEPIVNCLNRKGIICNPASIL